MMSAPTVSSTGASGRLLLIEDDTTQARMIEGMLKAAGSTFEITHLGTVAEGKRFLGTTASLACC